MGLFNWLWKPLRKKAPEASAPRARSPEDTLHEEYAPMAPPSREPAVRERLTAISQTVRKWHAQGRFREALPLAQEALRLARVCFDDRHPELADSLNLLAEVYRVLGNYAQARGLLEEALHLRRKLLGETHPALAQSMHNLGALFSMLGDFAAAEPLLRQALDRRLAVLGANHPEVAQSLQGLADLARWQGNYASADSLLRQALDIHWTAAVQQPQQASVDHAGFAQTLHSRAELALVQDDPWTAGPLLHQVLDLRWTVLGDKNPEVVQVLNSLAEFYLVQGNWTTASRLLQQALDFCRPVLGEGHPEVARSNQLLAELYRAQGNPAAAEPLFRRALEIWRTVLGEAHPSCAVCLMQLAEAYRLQGKLAAAEPLYRQALRIHRAALGEKHPAFATGLYHLAGLLHEQGNPAAAAPLYQQALDLRRALLPANHLHLAQSLHRLAEVQCALGNYAAAEPLYRQAVKILRQARGESHPDVAGCLHDWANLCAATGRAPLAFRLMLQAARIDDRLLGLLGSRDGDRERAAYWEQVEERLDDVLHLVVRSLATSLPVVQTALDLVLRRKRLATEAFAVRQQEALFGRRYPALRSRLEEWQRLRQELAQKTLTGPKAKGLSAHREMLAQGDAQKKQLEEELAREIPELHLTCKLRAADRHAVAAALPERTALVEFVHFREPAGPTRSPGGKGDSGGRYAAFVLLAAEPERVQVIDLGPAEAIAQYLATFRAGLLRAQSPSAPALAAGLALQTALFDPLRPALGGCTRLLLAPAGELLRLPFAVLPTRAGGCLIEEYPVSYLETGRDMLRWGSEAAVPVAEPVVIADPDFDLGSPEGDVPPVGDQKQLAYLLLDPSHQRFRRLPGTRAEGERIAGVLGVRPWLGTAALESRVKALRSPRLLHLASSSFFVAGASPSGGEAWGVGSGRPPAGLGLDNPLQRAGVALAGANGWFQPITLPPEVEDGLLTAADVADLDLRGTELVVLSGCETGLGEGPGDEPGFSLRHAFGLAGAKSLVLNCWKAPETQTCALLEDFYRRLLAGQGSAEALRDAQLKVRARWPAPYYWGGFLIQGDVRPLYNPQPRFPSFVEAIDPYVVGVPVAGKLFVGRNDILKRIRDNLASAEGKNILVLRGQRRTGKTSVLLRLRETLLRDSDGAYLPVFVDLQALTLSRTEGQFFFHLAHGLRQELQRQGVQVPEPVLDDFEKAPNTAFEFQFLARLTGALGDRRIFLMLDEFEALKWLIDQGRLSEETLDYCRHLMQHTSLLFLIAGTQKLRELTGHYWSVFFNLGLPLDIGTLKEADTRQLITEPVQSWYLLGRAAQDEIIRVAGCHPYFTQLVCKKLLEVRNESGVNVVTVHHVREAVDRALQIGEDQIGYPWTEPDCGPDERLVLSLLARLGADGLPVAAKLVRQHLEAAGFNAAVGEALNRLQVRGVLRQDSEDRLTFVVPLFQHWLVRKHYDNFPATLQYNEEHPLAGN
jgi:CHAT domain-containing protein/tetratricopeptide (TPR) repeat protein